MVLLLAAFFGWLFMQYAHLFEISEAAMRGAPHAPAEPPHITHLGVFWAFGCLITGAWSALVEICRDNENRWKLKNLGPRSPDYKFLAQVAPNEEMALLRGHPREASFAINEGRIIEDLISDRLRMAVAHNGKTYAGVDAAVYLAELSYFVHEDKSNETALRKAWAAQDEWLGS